MQRNNAKVKILKRDKLPLSRQEYIRRHQDSLLSLLIEENFERAKEIITRIAANKRHQLTRFDVECS